MLSRFAANIHGGYTLVARATAGKIAVGTILAVSIVTPQGWRLLATIAALALLFAAAGAYLGVDLEPEEQEEETDVPSHS